MKTNINVPDDIDRGELNKLTREIKETIAYRCSGKKKTFGSVDLWNIHRKKKSIPSRRELV